MRALVRLSEESTPPDLCTLQLQSIHSKKSSLTIENQCSTSSSFTEQAIVYVNKRPTSHVEPLFRAEAAMWIDACLINVWCMCYFMSDGTMIMDCPTHKPDRNVESLSATSILFNGTVWQLPNVFASSGPTSPSSRMYKRSTGICFFQPVHLTRYYVHAMLSPVQKKMCSRCTLSVYVAKILVVCMYVYINLYPERNF